MVCLKKEKEKICWAEIGNIRNWKLENMSENENFRALLHYWALFPMDLPHFLDTCPKRNNFFLGLNVEPIKSNRSTNNKEKIV